MASQETANAEKGTAPEASGSGRRAEPEVANASMEQPTDRPPTYQMGLQTLGATQILTGILVLAQGAVLGFLQYLSNIRHAFFFTFYTGYPVWGALFFISSGAISVAAGRKPTKTSMQNALGINISSAVIALLGVIFLAINLFINIKSLQNCQLSQTWDFCTFMGSSSTSLVFIMLTLTLLEFCITTYISTMWCKANCCS